MHDGKLITVQDGTSAQKRTVWVLKSVEVWERKGVTICSDSFCCPNAAGMQPFSNLRTLLEMCGITTTFIDDMWNVYFDVLLCPDRAVPDRGSIVKNNQLAVLHSILSVVSLGTSCIIGLYRIPTLIASFLSNRQTWVSPHTCFTVTSNTLLCALALRIKQTEFIFRWRWKL